MAIPYLGIAGGLLVGAALTGLASRFFGGRDAAQPATTNQTARNTNTVSRQPVQRPTAIQRPTYQASSSYTQRSPEPIGSRQRIVPRAGTVGVLTPTTVAGGSVSTLASSTSLAGEADNTASDITSLPVFTPTAPEPVTTTTNYQSTKRLEVQKSKAGEQTLRNPLDKERTSSAIESNLPSIGVSSSSPAGISEARPISILPITDQGPTRRGGLGKIKKGRY